jgi:hypothetical protein
MTEICGTSAPPVNLTMLAIRNAHHVRLQALAATRTEVSTSSTTTHIFGNITRGLSIWLSKFEKIRRSLRLRAVA